MNLHQFRFVQEAARRNLNLTETAKALHTSQPGISKAILELEEELGIDIFVRHGKRLKRITEPGLRVLQAVDVILREVANLKRIGEEYSKQDSGTLVIATTHTQARYLLPGPLVALRKRHPKVVVTLLEAAPPQVAQMLLDDRADVGLATEALASTEGLLSLPCYEWQHMLVMPADHPLAAVERLTLEQIAREPIVSYSTAYAGRSRIDQAFALKGLSPQIVLEATDADVIKTYVRHGMGLGIVPEITVKDDPACAPGGELVVRPMGQFFGRNTTRIAFKRSAYLRSFVYAFAELVSERMNRGLIEKLMAGEAEHYEL
ncbi:CysB family HTH-type transcriptional regulator [Piscinibacter sp. Jin2]|uniref:CysB family HTH-type transcriptional regulator n=1 Tax=Aquariibacter lacus TaxID=2801332 RepID=A0A9X0XD88_9BURK|nr:CysB family HTH-type transcriptional regulator [Piscinibacter lacus]MBL0720147.1 CysB family HTH-type transcriptional regulator [Piscinibacter lacus]